MKTSYKIALIVAVVVAILGSVFAFSRGVSISEQTRITPDNINAQVEEACKQFGDKKLDYAKARKTFNNILDVIRTEAFIKTTDGKPIYDEKDKKEAMKKVFEGFAPFFTEHGRGFFSKSSWPEGEMSQLKNEAQQLLSMAGKGNDKLADDCKYVIKTASDCQAAWSAVRSAGSCSSADAVKSIESKVNAYKHAPPTNNKALMSAISEAASKARNSYASGIESRIKHVASSYKSYRSYDAFIADYNSARSAASAYTSKLGSHSGISSALGSLESAKSNALSYFADKIANDDSGHHGKEESKAESKQEAARTLNEVDF